MASYIAVLPQEYYYIYGGVLPSGGRKNMKYEL
jgi:hypothetical protein